MRRKPVLALLLIAVILLSIHFLMRSGLFSDQVTRLVTARIDNLAGTHVTLDRVTLSLIPAALVLEGISLPPTGPETPPITIKQVQVSFSPWSLFTEVIFIKKIVLTEPSVQLHLGDKPLIPIRWPPPQTAPEPGAEKPRKLRAVIRDIQIRGGIFELRPETGPAILSTPHLEGRISPDLMMQTFDAQISATNVSVKQGAFHKTLDTLSGRFILRPPFLEIRRLEAAGAGSRYTLSGAIQNPARPEILMTLGTDFPMSDLNAWMPERLPLAGEARFSGEARGTWPDLSFMGSISASRITTASKAVGDLKASVLYEDGRLSFTDISASVFNGEIAGSASVPFPGTTAAPSAFQAVLDWKGIDPSVLLTIAEFPCCPAKHRMEGSLLIEGALGEKRIGREKLSGEGWVHVVRVAEAEAPSASPEIAPENGKASDLAAIGWTPESWPRLMAGLQEAETRFKILKGSFLFTPSQIRTDESLLTFRGSIPLDGPIALDLSVDSRDVSKPAALFNIRRFAGRLRLDGTLRGSRQRPVFAGEGRMKELSIRGQPFESAESDLVYRDREIRFKKAVFREGRARYELGGHVSFAEPPFPFFEIDAKIREGSPREVIAVFARELPIAVPATGRLSVKGVPRDFQLQADVRFGQGSIYGQTVDEGDARFVVTPHQIVFGKASAKRGESAVRGRGRIGFNGEYEFSMESDHAALQDIDPAKKFIPAINAPFKGTLDGKGTFKDPTLTGRFELLDLAFGDQTFGSGPLHLQVENRVVRGDLRLSRGWSASGELEWAGEHPYRLDLSFQEVDLKTWMTLLSEKLKAVQRSLVSGNAKISGRLAAGTEADPAVPLWRRTTVSADLSALTLEFQDYVVTNDGNIRFELKEGRTAIEAMRFKGPGTAISFAGEARLFESFNLFVTGEADLELFRIFTEEITYGKGIAYLAVEVTDRWEDPKIRGGLTIHNGALKSRSLGQTITVAMLGFSFNERQVFLDSFDAEAGGGRVTAAGRIDLVRFIPSRFGLNLELNAVQISFVKGLTGSVDGALMLQGDSEKQSLQGELLIRRAVYERRLDWQTWLIEMLTKNREGYRPPPWLMNLTMNVRVEGKKDVRISNNLAKVPLEIDLWLKGSPSRPILLGRIEMKGGAFEFQRNDFKITSGVVDFFNPERIRPVIDVQAVTRVREYAIELSAVGPADKFDLTLSSNPPLKDENEILCLLTFSRPCREVEGASRTLGAGEATNILSAEIQGAITDQVEQITGIDRIQVDPYHSSAKGGISPLISVSKRLFEDKLYVTYSTTMDPSQEQVIQMEYVLSDKISLIGNRDEEGRAGGDLKFHFEFR